MWMRVWCRDISQSFVMVVDLFVRWCTVMGFVCCFVWVVDRLESESVRMRPDDGVARKIYSMRIFGPGASYRTSTVSVVQGSGFRVLQIYW